MKTRHIYIFLFLMALVASCSKKKYPDSFTENAPVYNFNAVIDNQPVSIAAGVNNYYMYSSQEEDSHSVYNFIGSLKQVDCSDCRSSLKIQINDFKVSTLNAPVILDSTFYPRSFLLLGNVSAYQVQFQSSFNKTAASYYWDFGDGSTSDQQNPVHQYLQKGNYTIQLKTISASGCQSSIRQTKRINDTPDNFATAITVTGSAGNTINFSNVTSGGNGPYTYLWTFGDGQKSTEANPVHAYSIRGSYPVSLKVTDANNESLTANYNALTQNDNSSCAANYDIASVSKVANPILALGLSKIIITWTDADGVIYTSNSEQQPANSHFAITSVENGGANENNLSIKRLRVTFNCTVYNGTKALVINNAEATIGVAYK